jgi:nucleoside-diphosphate-sugar epimerase
MANDKRHLMAKVLITGGLGFIGFHTSMRFLSEGWKVVIYDAQKHFVPLNLSAWPKYLNYRLALLKDKEAVIVRGDCNDKLLFQKVVLEEKPDVIIHLAALPIAGICNDDPSEAKHNIFEASLSILEVLSANRVPLQKFVYISSSMVYGNFLRDANNAILPATEDQDCKPIDIYGAMKLSCEHMVEAFAYRFKIPYCIIRPSAVYGPTDSNARVTELFLRNAMTNSPIQIENEGTHQLDFTYVSDLAEGIYLASVKVESLGQILNISCGTGRTIGELANIVAGLVPSLKIEKSEVKPYRPNRGGMDISKAKRLLGYSPEYNLERGMKEYFTFIQNETL